MLNDSLIYLVLAFRSLNLSIKNNRNKKLLKNLLLLKNQYSF